MEHAALAEPIVQRIGWTLVHFVWQGALIGVATALALAVAGRTRSSARYAIAAAGLVFMVAAPIATLVSREAAPVSVRSPAEAFIGSVANAAVRAAAATQANGVSSGPGASFASFASANRLLPLMVVTWMTGVILLTGRLALGYAAVRRLTRDPARTVDDGIAGCVARMCARLGIARAVRVVESAAVSVPAVIGSLRPVILMPASVIAGLPAAQLEAIIAHELAHVRRHDYVVNALQVAVETLLFFHPAVWWCSRQVRIEREHCCDDLVVRVCGDRFEYARALAALEELRRPELALALGATDGPLLDRIRRLLSTTSPERSRTPAWLSVTALAFVVGMAAAAPVFSIVDRVEASDARIHLDRLDLRWEPPAPPTPPTPPTPATPPAPPTPAVIGPTLRPAPWRDIVVAWRESAGPLSFGGQSLSIRGEGAVVLSPDDRDIIEIPPGAQITLEQGGLIARWLGMGRTLELRGRFDGTVERRYTVGRRERPFAPDGRVWLGEILPRLAREGGLGAEGRVLRILQQEGAAGLVPALAALRSDWVRRRYVEIAAAQGSLSDADVAHLLRAARQIGSDYEAAEALIRIGSARGVPDAAVEDFRVAADQLGSDYEHRRVLEAVAAQTGASAALLDAALRSSEQIGSDFERATLLVAIAERYSLAGTLRDSYLRAARGIGSDYERGRALHALVSQLDAR